MQTKNNKKKKNIEKILKKIIILIMSIFITIIILLNIEKETILREEYILQKFEESRYYETAYQEIKIKLSDSIKQYGLDEELLKEIITQEQVKEDTKRVIQNIYQGTENKLNTERLKQTLNANIQLQLERTTIAENTEQTIQEVIDRIGQEYEDKIMQKQYDKKIDQIVQNGSSVIEKRVHIINIIAVILIITILILNIKKQKIKALVSLGMSMIISGIFLTLANIFINSRLFAEDVNVLSQSITTLVQIITNDILSKMLTNSIIMIVIGTFAIVFGNVLHKKRKK
ncbi:MAG: hypothetical protein HFJ48_05770 [Clostridia bacterium]|nr:hypothetical protein [Clostridia bacterium]